MNSSDKVSRSAPKRVLVTGANGAIGTRLVKLLANRGLMPIQGVRSERTRIRPEFPVLITGDLTASNTSALDFSSVAPIDCIVHLAGISSHQRHGSEEEWTSRNLRCAELVADAADTAGVGQLIFVSTSLIYDTGKPDKTDDDQVPSTAYARGKLACEEYLKSRDLKCALTIIRPPPVLRRNAGGSIGLLQKFVDWNVPLPLASVSHNRVDFVSLDVLCDFLIACIESPHAEGETFDVSDGFPLSTRQLVLNLAVADRKKAILFPVPVSLLRVILEKVSGRLASLLLDDYLIDGARAQETLGWTPPFCENFSRLHLGDRRNPS
ncbi:NAD-dependent epimerase/dehydratase family protein [Altererythrobacter sp. CAU 1778]